MSLSNSPFFHIKVFLLGSTASTIGATQSGLSIVHELPPSEDISIGRECYRGPLSLEFWSLVGKRQVQDNASSSNVGIENKVWLFCILPEHVGKADDCEAVVSVDDARLRLHAANAAALRSLPLSKKR